jgi:hypothetical protein
VLSNCLWKKGNNGRWRSGGGSNGDGERCRSSFRESESLEETEEEEENKNRRSLYTTVALSEIKRRKWKLWRNKKD